MWAQKFILHFVLLTIGLEIVPADDLYQNGCQYSCGTDFPHTMCMSEGATDHCANLQLTNTSQLKDEVLIWHNLYRNELAGGRSTGSYVPNMQKMYWDDDLEKMARIWASQCEPANDRCRKLERFEVGQNVGVLVGELTPQTSLRTFIDWVNPGPIKREYFLRPGSVRSHPNSARRQILKKFFQVLWPDTYLLGCAEATYDRNGFGHRLLVCNYGPSAFDRKSFEKIFSGKPPCSCCPGKTECPRSTSVGHPFTNLCTIPSYETVPGETERIDGARRTFLRLQKVTGTETVQAGRDLEVAEEPQFGEHGQAERENRHFEDHLNEYEGRNEDAGKSGTRALNAENKYCSIECNGRPHVMCQSMVWDKELTKLATRWALHCPRKQDGCRDVERFHVNQVVSISVSSENNNKSLAAMSVENNLKAGTFPVKAISKYNLPIPSSSSFLSQVLWANSSRVGCAEVLYVLKPSSRSKTTDSQKPNQYSSLVCNFGEGGNVRGKRIYRVGKPCSHCPKGTACSSKKLPYLCVKKMN